MHCSLRCLARSEPFRTRLHSVTSRTSHLILRAHVRHKSDSSGSFADRARIVATGGTGGTGIVSFARGPNQEIAPPDGGSGGKGGDVWLEACDTSLTLRMSTTQKRAESGSAGQGGKRRGGCGSDLIVRVPAGTVARLLDEEGQAGMVVCDLDAPGERACVARGGAGGRGNATFKSSRNRSPVQSGRGEPGEITPLQLELKTIADVGLVGFPNAGKSTLLRAVSEAKPRVAAYAFTTLRPHIGVVRRGERRVTVADIPGLIDGAHADRGLGHEFLRHVERTKALVYVVDLVDWEVKPAMALRVLQEELEAYQEGLSERVKAVVANKMDKGEAAVEALHELVGEVGDRFDVFPTAAAVGNGTEDVVEHLFEVMQEEERSEMRTEAQQERELWLWEQRETLEYGNDANREEGTS